MAEAWIPQLQMWLHGHSGIVPIPNLIEFGCSRRDAYRLAETDNFEIIMPGVLRSTHWPFGTDQLMMAACLRSSIAVIARTNAAQMWNFRGLPKPDGEVRVLIPHGRSVILPGVIVEKCRQIDAVDIVQRSDGLRLTSPSRTLFDCADILGTRRTGSVFEQLIDEKKASFVTQAATVARLARPGRPGTHTMAAVIASRPAWRAGLQSDLEVLVLEAIELAGLPTPQTQMWFVLPGGRRIRLDFAWPDKQVALEVDHPFWHAGAAESDRDKRRDLKMTTVGWLTLRITDLDVNGGLAVSINDVALTLALR